MPQIMTTEQTMVYRLALQNKTGDPTTTLLSPIVWASSNTAVATIAPSPDGFSAKATGVGNGVTTISATTNLIRASDGSAQPDIKSDNLTVGGGDPVASVLTADPPQAKV